MFVKTPKTSLAAEVFVFEEEQNAENCGTLHTDSLALPSEFYQYFSIEEAA